MGGPVAKINAEALAPVGLEMRVTSSAAFPDMTQIASVHIEVLDPNGNHLEWTADISPAETTKTLLVAFHGFEAGDLPNTRLGTHRARLYYTDNSNNTGRSLVRYFDVVDKDAVI